MKKIFSLWVLLLPLLLQQEKIKLIGTWECYYKELEDGTTKSTDFDGNEFTFSCDGISFKLKKDMSGIEFTNNQKFNYKIIQDSILHLGNRQYIIEKLTEAKLVLRDYDPKGFNINNSRLKFKKKK